ncbi:MAG: two-component sensor histidine kinase [Verrucomicrobia bacterium]|nr:MAG: two-component sensor histidine kinase [Verrucomicrobiota bacterium]PYJ28715.1 MAG: two-component sensor histidine kinase [Verrucomicrobiota bacterium]PYJ42029.1 MAG: two-component sensor histidine kinase [Verrucomicrobiota bacterium]
MFSKHVKPRSIASQLILLFTLATALLLVCGLGVFYSLTVRHAFAEDNAVLADKVSALSADFHESGSNVFADELNARRAGEHPAYWIRILDPQGRTFAETPGMDRLLPPGIFPSGQNLALAVRSPKAYRTGAKLFSLVTLNEESGSQAYTFQVAQDRSSDERVERDFAVLFVILLLGSVLSAASIAIIVTKRGLRPLEQMTRSLGRVDPTHLKERVAPGSWPSELQPLAIAFDDMLKRLDDSFTRLSQFSADLAHELRTPVANMMGEAQVALTRERTAAEYRETIESTIGECERLSRIVDNLLFVARVDAAREPIARKRFDARKAVEKIAAFYQTAAEDRHVTITCSGQGQIYADPDLFERAVGNLLDNALRFAPDRGSIQVAVSKHSNDFEVAISDNGCGIAAEHLPRVFDRFYRAESSRTSDGAGLGLALVKSIVELHGGSASIQSEMGRGTTVKLTFPAVSQRDHGSVDGPADL